MDLRHLRYFIAVAEHGSMRAAAERIHIAQPAISRHIRTLEAELGVALFHRASRGLVLTAPGARFLREARRSVARLAEAAALARDTAAGVRGQLRIGFIENSGWDGIVPGAFRRFQRAAPEVRVELIPLGSKAQIDQIMAHELDGGFINKLMALPTEFGEMAVTTNDVMLAVPRRSDWALPNPVAAAALNGMPMVGFLRSVNPPHFEALSRAFARAGVVPRVLQEVESEAAAMALVSAGVGAAVVNTANRARPPALVQFLEFSDLSIPMPCAFVYLAESTNPALTRFRQALGMAITDALIGHAATG